MIFTKKQQGEMLEAAKSLIKFLNDNCHPHVVAIVTCNSVEVLEGVARVPTDEFLKD